MQPTQRTPLLSVTVEEEYGKNKKTASRSRTEKLVLLEVAVRHRPAHSAAGLCSRMPLPKAIGARPRRVHGAQRTDGALAGGGNHDFF